MLDTVRRRARVGLDPLRLAHAARILTTSDLPISSGPNGSVCAGHILFAAALAGAPERAEFIRRFADDHALDLVLVETATDYMEGADANFTFELGFFFIGCRVWLEQRLLWRPADGMPAWFAPPSDGLSCAVRNGRLLGHEHVPWPNAADRQRGLEAATSGLLRLESGR